jgi:hypothetical protein
VSGFVVFINTHKPEGSPTLRHEDLPYLEQFEDWRTEYHAQTIASKSKNGRIGNEVFILHMAAVKIATAYNLRTVFQRYVSFASKVELPTVQCSSCQLTLGASRTIDDIQQHTHRHHPVQDPSLEIPWDMLCCHQCNVLVHDRRSMYWH